MTALSQAVVSLERDAALGTVSRQLDAGGDPRDVVEEARCALAEAYALLATGEFSPLKFMRAVQLFQDICKTISLRTIALRGDEATRGSVVIGTVAGDMHDLGKSIVKVLLECEGYTVVDLGVDVPSAGFVDAVREHQPRAVGLSALLTASIPQLRATVDALCDAGVRGTVKVIIGGGIVDKVDLDHVRADHAARTASEGVKVITGWTDAADGVI